MHFGCRAYFWKDELTSFPTTPNFTYFALKIKELDNLQFSYIIMTNMRISCTNMRISRKNFMQLDRAMSGLFNNTKIRQFGLLLAEI